MLGKGPTIGRRSAYALERTFECDIVSNGLIERGIEDLLWISVCALSNSYQMKRLVEQRRFKVV